MNIIIFLIVSVLLQSNTFCDPHDAPGRSCYDIMNDYSPIPSDKDLVLLDRNGQMTFIQSDRIYTVITPTGDEYTVYPLNPRQETLYKLSMEVNGGPWEGQTFFNHKLRIDYELEDEMYRPDIIPEVDPILSISDLYFYKIRNAVIRNDLSPEQLKNYICSMLKEDKDKIKCYWLFSSEAELYSPNSFCNRLISYNVDRVNATFAFPIRDRLILAHLHTCLTIINSAFLCNKNIDNALADTAVYDSVLKMQMNYVGL